MVRAAIERAVSWLTAASHLWCRWPAEWRSPWIPINHCLWTCAYRDMRFMDLTASRW